MEKNYKVYDIHNGYEKRTKIGEYQTITEVKEAIKKWSATKKRNEFDFAVYQWVESLKGHYLMGDEWKY